MIGNLLMLLAVIASLGLSAIVLNYFAARRVPVRVRTQENALRPPTDPAEN